MDQDQAPAVDTSLAAHAFSELRAEISLLRRATERLTDERTAQPDYAPTLETLAKRLEDVSGWAQRIDEKPAMKLTPETFGRGITDAAASSRADDRRMLTEAAGRMDAAGNRVDAMIARSRSVTEQRRELMHNRIAFAAAGMVAFAILPGAIARSLPVSWAIPERIAARMLGTDMWRAGEDMMAKADPKRWNELATKAGQAAEPGIGDQGNSCATNPALCQTEVRAASLQARADCRRPCPRPSRRPAERN